MSSIIRERAMPRAVSQAQPDVRAAFIRRTYLHLASAVAAFVGLEIWIFHTEAVLTPILEFVFSGGQIRWLMVLGAFLVAGWMARSLAGNVASVPLQYAGLALYVVAEALIFVPLLAIALFYVQDPTLLPTAAALTISLFIGLTAVVFITRKDFSFLGGILGIGGMLALGLIVAGALFGFTLGLLFSGFMVALACGAILYDTSKILHSYPEDRHVAASLELFASVALLFWYVIRILLFFSRR